MTGEEAAVLTAALGKVVEAAPRRPVIPPE